MTTITQTDEGLSARVAKLEVQSIKMNSRKDVESAVRNAITDVATASHVTEVGRDFALKAIQNVMRNSSSAVTDELRSAVITVVHANTGLIMNTVSNAIHDSTSLRTALVEQLTRAVEGELDINEVVNSAVEAYLNRYMGNSSIEQAVTARLLESATFLRKMGNSAALHDGLMIKHREWATNIQYRLTPV